MILAKIGGSSLKKPAGFKECLQILKLRPKIKVIVVSAIYNVTNILEQLRDQSLVKDYDGITKTLKLLKDKHLPFASERVLIDELVFKAQTISLKILKEETCSLELMDSLYSVGELLSSKLLADYLDKNLDQEVTFINACEIIKTDSNFSCASPDFKKIKDNVRFLPKDKLCVVPGFIGSDNEGNTTTLGREGSDLTAVLLSKALNVDELHIYKDVAGIYTADPKVVGQAKAISEIDFNSINTLSKLGAKVLFPKALAPIMNDNIKVFIGSTFDPECGTNIIKVCDSNCKGITLRDYFFRVDLVSKFNNDFKDNVLKLLELENIIPDYIMEEDNKLGLIISNKYQVSTGLRDHLREFCEIDQENNLSLISIVGRPNEKLIQRVLGHFEKGQVTLEQIVGEADFSVFVVPTKTSNEALNYFHQNIF